jgi:hypothetical protein
VQFLKLSLKVYHHDQHGGHGDKLLMNVFKTALVFLNVVPP